MTEAIMPTSLLCAIKKSKSNTPIVIINKLRSNLQCGQDDCCLNQLSEKDSKKIDNQVFAPDHPDEWNKNPTEWLSEQGFMAF